MSDYERERAVMEGEMIAAGEAMPYYTAQPGESATIRAQVAPGRWEDVPRRSEANK